MAQNLSIVIFTGRCNLVTPFVTIQQAAVRLKFIQLALPA